MGQQLRTLPLRSSKRAHLVREKIQKREGNEGKSKRRIVGNGDHEDNSKKRPEENFFRITEEDRVVVGHVTAPQENHNLSIFSLKREKQGLLGQRMETKADK